MMQDQSMLSQEKALGPKSRKKKPSMQKSSMLAGKGENVNKIQESRALPIQKAPKSSKRGQVNGVAAILQQPDKSTSDSLADSSPSSGNDYRALRRKYLLLEEDSFTLGRDLNAVEDEIKALEEEKLSLLDELVVLEGLVDPSEVTKAT
ncbi:OLC1v1010404C1 [Oldenlandia corymbosa var. corymbosa]|uniref:OLC1v1010404C1 n=1 Tax=Oldenlandia corymbosa var. corymbosa TaxID=529605 RepID=A0AAV1DR79_OLDCO|nr:OLC1v1010404C1 [Oldenlandia corymbosa var. corymbosa]